MFFHGINEFESKFKLLDRLNILVFNVWRDKKAQEYKDGNVARLTNEYRNYISRVRSLAEEANQLHKGLDEQLREIERLKHDVINTALNPGINNCDIWSARSEEAVYDSEGRISHYRQCGSARFVAKGLNGAPSNTKNATAARYLGHCDKIHVDLERHL